MLSILYLTIFDTVRNEKAIDLSLKLASECSPDGWYWNINRFVGDICAQNGEWNLVAEQYDLSLKGIRRIVDHQSARMNVLYEQGYMIKPNGFVSWEDEALKSHTATIIEIEDLLMQSRSY